MSPYRISKCPACDQPLPESAKGLVAARVQRAATVNVRNPDASRNELATALAAVNAEDVVDPRSAYAEPRRSVDQHGEEPDRFDEAWEGGRNV